MDAKTNEYMRTFLYRHSNGSRYRIGVCFSENERQVLLLTGVSKIDDFLGSNFTKIATLLYHKVFKPRGYEPDGVSWGQHYPGFNGFRDTYEWVFMDWNGEKDRYEMFFRQPMNKEDIESITKGFKKIQ